MQPLVNIQDRSILYLGETNKSMEPNDDDHLIMMMIKGIGKGESSYMPTENMERMLERINEERC